MDEEHNLQADIEHLQLAYIYLCEQVEQQQVDTEKLRGQLDAIKRHWQYGVQELDNAWKQKMAELVGDAE